MSGRFLLRDHFISLRMPSRGAKFVKPFILAGSGHDSLPPSLDAVRNEYSQRKGRPDMIAPPPLKLRLLGRFSATADGNPPVQLKISSKKGVALLAYLALHPEHSVSREKLATLLWGDRPDRQARLSLRQVILSLRKTFAESELIVLDGDAVGLRMDRVSVDALEFQKLSRSTEPGDLARAAALYGGPFLSEMDIEPEDFAAWLQLTRARFEAEGARVLESCAGQSDATDQGLLAIDAAERLVALDPLREDWQRRLLRIYARHRGAEVALAHAKTLVALLQKGLDVEPEPETSELIEEIRRGARELVRPAQQLPLFANSGNEAEAPAEPRIVVADVPRHLPAPPGAAVAEAHRSASLWRASVGALWFVVPVCVLFGGALLLGNPQLTSVRKTLASSEIASIANARSESAPVVVLPFEAADRQASAMAELVSDDIIDQLSRVPNLLVISRLTSHQLWHSRDIVDVGNRLNVRYTVHGSVKTGPDKWHVNVELIDVASRLQVWSDQFDQSSPDRTEAAKMIADQLGRALQVAVIKYQAERGNNLPSARPAVDLLIGQGWNALVSKSDAEAMALAEMRFSEALRRDPEQISAMLGLAAHHVVALGLIMTPEREPYLSEAETLLARVLERRPGSSPAYYYLGLAQVLRGDRQAALGSLQKSVALNTEFCPRLCDDRTRADHAGTERRRAAEHPACAGFESQDPASPLWDLATGLVELELGRDHVAIEWISRGVAANPENPFAQISLAAAYVLAGDQADADLHVAKFRELTGNFTNEQRVELFPGWRAGPYAALCDSRASA